MSIQEVTKTWYITQGGEQYEIRYDHTRPYLSPKWYVVDDLNMRSKRYYSWASGAFLALSTGAIKWVV